MTFLALIAIPLVWLTLPLASLVGAAPLTNRSNASDTDMYFERPERHPLVIFGIVMGAFLVVVLAAALFLWIRKRSRKPTPLVIGRPHLVNNGIDANFGSNVALIPLPVPQPVYLQHLGAVDSQTTLTKFGDVAKGTNPLGSNPPTPPTSPFVSSLYDNNFDLSGEADNHSELSVDVVIEDKEVEIDCSLPQTLPASPKLTSTNSKEENHCGAQNEAPEEYYTNGTEQSLPQEPISAFDDDTDDGEEDDEDEPSSDDVDHPKKDDFS
ncbi:MAG: hypothetical protein ABW189_09300 [Rickettsiales bacterium]